MVTKKEVKKSATELVRKIILGVAIIILVGTSAYLINTFIVEPIKHHQNGTDTTVTDEDNTNTTKLDGSDVGIQTKYTALLKINPDFVGKLYIEAIEETGFNVVQAEDNNKYLNLGFKGETTRYGTLFVDYRNNIKDFNTNTIIYGHNMRDGSQLGSLTIYEDIENYKAYPTIEFNTIYSNYKWKVFAAFLSNGEKAQDNGYSFPYLTTNFPSEKSFLKFIDEVKARSYYTNDAVDIKPGDKILTLSTCDTIFEDARFVVMARLVRDGESAEVDTSKAKVNENQRFPQAWYDVKGKKNPFRNADKFTID
ncbi:MAG: class B sortase [Clostridia bacterium]|nr:class B sortase [Clostridia bacterium]